MSRQNAEGGAFSHTNFAQIEMPTKHLEGVADSEQVFLVGGISGIVVDYFINELKIVLLPGFILAVERATGAARGDVNIEGAGMRKFAFQPNIENGIGQMKLLNQLTDISHALIRSTFVHIQDCDCRFSRLHIIRGAKLFDLFKMDGFNPASPYWFRG